MDKSAAVGLNLMANPSTAGQRYAVWGSAGHAKVLASLIALNGGEIIALFDNNDVAPAVDGVPLYIGESGFVAWANTVTSLNEVIGLVAIGGARGRDRLAIQILFQTRGLRSTSVIHPDASVCASANLGAGTQVLAQAVVAAEVRIGQVCIINHHASVDHECVLGNGVHVAPGATLCGCIAIGDNVMIGAGAVILPRLSIGSDSVIGAGALVTKNVPPGVTVMGNPARIVRKN